MKKPPNPLWTCPKCGAKLVSKNLSHSCGNATLDDWYARMSPRARQLYDRFEQMIAESGEYHVSPAKTRIAFLCRVCFASISSISDAGMTIVFADALSVALASFWQGSRNKTGTAFCRDLDCENAEICPQLTESPRNGDKVNRGYTLNRRKLWANPLLCEPGKQFSRLEAWLHLTNIGDRHGQPRRRTQPGRVPSKRPTPGRAMELEPGGSLPVPAAA